jgi:hypothetical protein
MPESSNAGPEPSRSVTGLFAFVAALGVFFAIFHGVGATPARSTVGAVLAACITYALERAREMRGLSRERIVAVAAMALAFLPLFLLSVGGANKPVVPPTTPTSGPKSSVPDKTTSGNGSIVVYLDDLHETSNNGKLATLGALHLGADSFPHGVSAHSSGYVGVSSDTPDETTFTLPGAFAYFRTLVGFDPNANNGAISGQMGVEVSRRSCSR